MDKWQFLDRAPRPLLRWACIVIALWTAMICDIAGHPQDAGTRGLLLAFVTSVYGLRGWENIKGNAK